VPLVFVKNSIKILPVIFMAFVIITPFAIGSEIADYLDELVYVEFQISAVTTDMYMYLGWFEDKKDWIKEASLEAISDLEEIEKSIMNLDVPGELIELREANKAIIQKLKTIYAGIENKKPEDIKAEFESFNKLYAKYSEDFKHALKEYRDMQELPQVFDPIIEELKLASNQKDKDAYQRATKLINEKNYNQAYEILSQLKVKYEGLPLEDCILLRISDCGLKADSDLDVENKLQMKEDGLDVLTQIVNKNSYSPVLYEAFYKWRTTEQYYNHGMSNMSHIPNKEYNKKRWEIIQVLKKQLKDVPDDRWAQEQVDLLLSLPNITRGGPMGNHNLEHWGSLYVDLSKFEEKE